MGLSQPASHGRNGVPAPCERRPRRPRLAHESTRVNGFLGPNGACWIIQTTRLKLALRAISWGGGRHAGLRQQLYS